MVYRESDQVEFRDEKDSISSDLSSLLLNTNIEAEKLPEGNSKEFLNHGVCRRLGSIKHCLDRIFSIFPPDRNELLEREELLDVQVYLQSFIGNLFGVFDNWAWAFVYRHKIESLVNKKHCVGMFQPETITHLPASIKSYLVTETTKKWHREYLKIFRDALAHQIPLYIPPCVYSDAEAELYRDLETERYACIKSHNWSRLEEIYDEEKTLGIPCYNFVHSFSESGGPRIGYIHPQILCDSLLIVEFGKIFNKNWHECT